MFESTASPVTSRPRALAWSVARTLPAVAVGVLFVFIGYGKFDGNPRRMWFQIFEQIGLGQWFRIFTGVVQVSGGALMLLRRTRTAGAALLGCTMVGATIVDIVVVGSPVAIVPMLLLIVILVIWVTSR